MASTAAASAEAVSSPAVRVVLIGFGSVGIHFVKLVLRHQRRGVGGRRVLVVGVADSAGAISTINKAGLDLVALLAHKQGGASVATIQSKGTGRMVSPDASQRMASDHEYDVLLDLSPCDADAGMLSARAALRRGKHVVFANKGPLVADYPGLHRLGASAGSELRFSATVCGGLPVVNIGQRDLVGAEIDEVVGIFNSTSNYVIGQIEAGNSREDGVAEAQRRGIAEADPAIDLEGGDTANKLVIIANAVLGIPAKMSDVTVSGVMGIDLADVDAARNDGMVLRLLARAKKDPEAAATHGYRLTVGAERVPSRSFLGLCVETDMGIIISTDIYEEQAFRTNETGVYPTAAAVMRDLFSLPALAPTSRPSSIEVARHRAAVAVAPDGPPPEGGSDAERRAAQQQRELAEMRSQLSEAQSEADASATRYEEELRRHTASAVAPLKQQIAEHDRLLGAAAKTQAELAAAMDDNVNLRKLLQTAQSLRHDDDAPLKQQVAQQQVDLAAAREGAASPLASSSIHSPEAKVISSRIDALGNLARSLPAPVPALAADAPTWATDARGRGGRPPQPPQASRTPTDDQVQEHPVDWLSVRGDRLAQRLALAEAKFLEVSKRS